MQIALAGNNADHRAVKFIPLTHGNFGFDMHGLQNGGKRVTLLISAPSSGAC